MGTLARIFCCGASRSQSDDPKRIRILEGHPERPNRQSVPIWIAHTSSEESLLAIDCSPPDLLIDIDEKEVVLVDDTLAPSSASSIISIPSTHVTSIPPSNAENTALNRQSYDSDWMNPPPSYHSRRTPSPRPGSQDSDQHPVMAAGWLERLQNEAYARSRPPQITNSVVGHHGQAHVVSNPLSTSRPNDGAEATMTAPNPFQAAPAGLDPPPQLRQEEGTGANLLGLEG